MANRNSSVRFRINFAAKQIVGTKASFDKAGKGYGPIYDELAEKLANHPDFALVVIKPKSNKTREVYPGMDIDWMRDYIAMVDDANFARSFEQVIKFAENSKRSKYPLAKKVFLKHFRGDDGVIHFDYAEACADVEAYRIGKTAVEAVKKAASTEGDNTDARAA